MRPKTLLTTPLLLLIYFSFPGNKSANAAATIEDQYVSNEINKQMILNEQNPEKLFKLVEEMDKNKIRICTEANWIDASDFAVLHQDYSVLYFPLHSCYKYPPKCLVGNPVALAEYILRHINDDLKNDFESAKKFLEKKYGSIFQDVLDILIDRVLTMEKPELLEIFLSARMFYEPPDMKDFDFSIHKALYYDNLGIYFSDAIRFGNISLVINHPTWSEKDNYWHFLLKLALKLGNTELARLIWSHKIGDQKELERMTKAILTTPFIAGGDSMITTIISLLPDLTDAMRQHLLEIAIYTGCSRGIINRLAPRPDAEVNIVMDNMNKRSDVVCLHYFETEILKQFRKSLPSIELTRTCEYNAAFAKLLLESCDGDRGKMLSLGRFLVDPNSEINYSLLQLDSVLNAGIPIDGLIYEKIPKDRYKLVYYLGMLASQGRYDFMNEFKPIGIVAIKDILAHLRSRNVSIDEVMLQSGFFASYKFRSAFSEIQSNLLLCIQDLIFDYLDRALI